MVCPTTARPELSVGFCDGLRVGPTVLHALQMCDVRSLGRIPCRGMEKDGPSGSFDYAPIIAIGGQTVAALRSG